MTPQADHDRLVIEQFTKQAVPFSKMPGHAASVDILVRLARPSASDEVLDVACGPGMVACSFAPLAGHVTGIDLTPGMIDRARSLQAEKGLANLTWVVGPAAPLPFPDAAFGVVLTRYSFHHFLRPAEVLAEMVRVCRPGGRVVVADVLVPPEKVAAYDAAETLRDPSHVHALTPDELADLLRGTPLRDLAAEHYQVEMELEQVLAGSFPNPGDADRLRDLFRADVGADRLGMNAHLRGDAIHFAYPITVVAGTKP